MVSASSALAGPSPRVLHDGVVRRPLEPYRPGLFTRMVDAIAQSRRRRAERDIARWMAMRGGDKITDSLEREMERRFLRGQPDWLSR